MHSHKKMQFRPSGLKSQKIKKKVKNLKILSLKTKFKAYNKNFIHSIKKKNHKKSFSLVCKESYRKLNLRPRDHPKIGGSI